MRIFLAAIMLLGGCAGSILPKVVRIPIPVTCVEAGDIPADVPPAGPLPDDARQAADLLASVVLSLRATDRSMRALLKGCTQ